MAISEYDAFGPWIYEIDAEHPVPKLFAPCLPQDEPAQMLFKIPRNIERRVAEPGMDLYDYVVGAYADRVCILSRQGHQVKTHWIAYADMEALQLRRHFLSGLLTFYVKGGTVELPFNTVSIREMQRFMTHVRSRMLHSSAALPPEISSRQTEVALNPLFTNMLRDLRADGETPLLYAYQPAVPCAPTGRGGLAGLIERLRPAMLPAALHVLTPRELLVIQQETAVGKDAGDPFIYHYFYLPVANIRQAEFRPGDMIPDPVCAVVLGEHRFPFAAKENNQQISDFYALLRTYLA